MTRLSKCNDKTNKTVFVLAVKKINAMEKTRIVTGSVREIHMTQS